MQNFVNEHPLICWALLCWILTLFFYQLYAVNFAVTKCEIIATLLKTNKIQ